ncbi:MAG TPA: sensor domain-containing protein [Trebonia sp.]|nr:sensor domain-containing protein [Trebonia sp.]
MSVLSLRRDPFRLLFSRAPWASAWYVLAYLFTGPALFAVTLAAVLTAGALSITLAGLPLLVVAAAVVQGCATAERWRLQDVSAEAVSGGYRPVTRPGLLARLATQWKDPAIWRDLAYLVALFVPLMVLNTVALALWLVLLAGITLPAWYHYPTQTWTIGVSGRGVSSAHGVQLGYFPHGPHGSGAWGLYVDTLPKAIITAAACLVAFLLFNYVLIAVARLHAAIARALLGAPQDPLREAKEVLARPGPLADAPRQI